MAVQLSLRTHLTRGLDLPPQPQDLLLVLLTARTFELSETIPRELPLSREKQSQRFPLELLTTA